MVVAREAHEPPLEEGDVEDGRIEIDELEYEDFEGEVVLEFRLRPVHLCGGRGRVRRRKKRCWVMV